MQLDAGGIFSVISGVGDDLRLAGADRTDAVLDRCAQLDAPLADRAAIAVGGTGADKGDDLRGVSLEFHGFGVRQLVADTSQTQFAAGSFLP